MKMRNPAGRFKSVCRKTTLAGAVLLALVLAAGLSDRVPTTRASDRSEAAPSHGNPRYLSPVDLKISPDGERLYVVCEDSDQVLVVNTRTNSVTAHVAVGDRPQSLALSPDGKRLFVTIEHGGNIAELDAETLASRRTLQAGWGPAGIAVGGDGNSLYVANTLGGDVSVLDMGTGAESKRLDAGRFPEYVALSRDRRTVFVANVLPQLHPYDQPPTSELTAIDAGTNVISEHVMLPGVIELRHIAEVPPAQGGYLLVPFLRPKNLNTLVRIQQGWYLTHGVAVVRPPRARGGKFEVTEVLLDDIDRAHADNFGAAATPDGRWALITASGTNEVSVIDIARLNRFLLRAQKSDPEALANRLDSARYFVAQRIATGRNPTAAAISPDSRFAFISNRMDDTLSVIDLRQMKVTSTIDLGGPKEISTLRHGQQLFYDAGICYQRQMACASCHPHGGLSDGLAWSRETPQLGRDVVENRTLFSIDGTAPFKWNGKNPDLQTQDGPRAAMFIFRSEGFSREEADDLAAFILSLRLPPNPRGGSDGNLTESQARGQAIFFRTQTNAGAPIPLEARCDHCHTPYTHYTARVSKDVGTATRYDTIKAFDIPQLEGVYMRAPYLHNGMALSLEEIWTKFNPDDKHGITSDMDKVQLNDLIEFLKTL
jgi:YVTN family beta-propeller protein